MERDEILGLRVFLLGVLRLISEGEKESFDFVEKGLSDGIATIISEKHKAIFDWNLSYEATQSVNEYYKQFMGVADGKESKYQCVNDNGLQLLVALALDDIY